MPVLVRKLVIAAAADGLVVLPSGQRTQRITSGLQIDYSTHEIRPCSFDDYQTHQEPTISIESYGIVGLLSIASDSYVVSISGREEVASIRGKAVYVISSVSFIPLSSQTESQRAILGAKEALKKEFGGRSAGATADSDTSDDEEDHPAEGHEELDLPLLTTPKAAKGSRPVTPQTAHQRNTSVAEDVINKKGQYGRFAERWFSKKGWSVEKRRMQGMSTNVLEDSQASKDKGTEAREPTETAPAAKASDGPSDSLPPPEQSQASVAVGTHEIAKKFTPKLLQTTKLLLESRSFFFSYDYDITRRFGSQEVKSSELPLHRSVDPLYFWNHHLILPFTRGGYHTFVFPIMQGFVGQRIFTIEQASTGQAVSGAHENPEDIIKIQENATAVSDAHVSQGRQAFLITLISRRSIMRPGLRYLRRGVDDNGNTANSVETEQILSKPAWRASDKVFSFTQIRGSIPLYFSQSPYSFKPVPVLQHSFETNHIAFKEHFKDLVSRYGGIQIALLVDKHGGEAQIGQEYERHTEKLNDDNGISGTKIGFEWFDFHAVCRGMKFENVSLLMKSLTSSLDSFGVTVEVDGKLQTRQSGVLRTNCMDCLDRTNVVQSACGQRALEQQLKEEGLGINLQSDETTQWFNTLWADNGDAISKQYSSTRALKGDYTRTRKRDYRGAINDLGLTLSRYYNNIINDYFCQAAIDYLLGNVTSQVFEEFEANMMSGDPAMSMRKVRQNAIDVSSKIVISEGSEELVGGWTLQCPRENSTVRTHPFEEAVLLLTDAALYAVRFDWNMAKVSSFERVDLRSVTGITYGTYITSTLAASQMDEQRNVGFVVKYRPGKKDIARVNTRSLTSAVGNDGKTEAGSEGDADPSPTPACDTCDAEGADGLSTKDSASKLKILAFKALPARSSVASGDGQEAPLVVTEKEMVRSICEEIERAVWGGKATEQEREKGPGFVEERDIISLSEAKKGTGLLEQFTHSLKKLVWA
ncbi:MAG: hypothetical protein FRX48_04263 [Lasallia pustulata]|uniref:SacI domain-containing protein n=1 Tax=Lasallia pustulata TaxID=136370 RepID=A0A5M8PRG4_9LECA|nr:MAG: hypothetical protein FRX48_04263 [Lasallia pustulata]